MLYDIYTLIIFDRGDLNGAITGSAFRLRASKLTWMLYDVVEKGIKTSDYMAHYVED